MTTMKRDPVVVELAWFLLQERRTPRYFKREDWDIICQQEFLVNAPTERDILAQAERLAEKFDIRLRDDTTD